MNKMKFLTTVLLMIFSCPAFSQIQPEMADSMRAEGKIYVVVAIILIVLAGLLIYLFLLDKKLKRLENLLREKHPQTK